MNRAHARFMNRCLVLAVLVLSACGGRTLAEDDASESSETGETGDPFADHHELWRIDHFNVDMLFVIDDSESMARVQARLAELAPVFEELDQLNCNGGR